MEEGDYGVHNRLGVFMDFRNTAQCSGTVVAWKYCYYKQNSGTDQLSVKFLVYRQEGLSDTYRAVTESISIVDISVTTTETTFECRQLILTNQEQFQIEKNDVIGMCISPTTADNNAAITLLGYSLHSSQVYMPSNINSDDCEVDMIRDVDTRTDSAHIDDVGLHLSAQINGKY